MPDADLEAVHRHLHLAIRRWAHAAAAASAAVLAGPSGALEASAPRLAVEQ